MTDKWAYTNVNTKGPGDSRPTALQIVQDDNLEGALSDKVFLVTGTSSGIGIDTAKALAATGAKVFATSRDLKKGEEALADVIAPKGTVELIQLDLNSLDSVRACAKTVLEKTDKLNVLVNNAGIMLSPEGKTADGFELQFGTNHLAHFLLFQLLKPTLLASSTPDFHSRVVCVSSTAHRGTTIHFDNLMLEGIYSPGLGYQQSKLANLYMANEVERRYGSKGLHALSLHPGGIFTNLQQHIPAEAKKGWDTEEVRNGVKSPAQGAATSVWAAVGKVWEGRGGRYLEDCVESKPVEEGWTVVSQGYVPHAYNEEGEKRLWVESLKLVGLKDDQ